MIWSIHIKTICTETFKENREIIINAVDNGYIKIGKSVSIISGTLHDLHFKNQVGKEYIEYVMFIYGSCVAFDFLVKNPNVDFDISTTIGLKDHNAMN